MIAAAAGSSLLMYECREYSSVDYEEYERDNMLKSRREERAHRMFSSFRSRWMTGVCEWCRRASASHTSQKIRSTSRSAKMPPRPDAAAVASAACAFRCIAIRRSFICWSTEPARTQHGTLTHDVVQGNWTFVRLTPSKRIF